MAQGAVVSAAGSVLGSDTALPGSPELALTRRCDSGDQGCAEPELVKPNLINTDFL